MQNVTVNTLDFDLNYSVPETPEEFDQRAKQQGACVKEASNNVLYRVTFAEFRDLYTERLEKETGIERLTKVVKPEQRNEAGEITQEEVVAWDESEKKYANRVYAQLVADGKFPTIEAARASFLPLAQKTIDSIPFDPSVAERTSGPKKTPKTYVEVAQAIIDQGGAEKAATKLSGLLGRAVTPDLDSLARAVWDDQKRQKAQLAAGYAA
jgi:hypothetical protein